MKKKTKQVVSILFVLLMVEPLYTSAENTSPISIQPELPENQVENKKGYYHLHVQPNQKQELYMNVNNLTDEEQTIEIYPINSYTNPSGGILYREETDVDENTQLLRPELAITNIITTPESVTIPAGAAERVAISVKIPEHITSGTLIGAIRVAAMEGDEEAQVGDTDVTINNQISFTTAVQLDLPEEPKPKFSFGDVGIQTDSPQTELWVEMLNEAQLILRGTTVTYQVLFEGQEVFSGSTDEFTMVPHTSIRYPIEWGVQNLDAGQYTINLTADVKGGTTIQEQRTFEVEREQSQQHEEHAETTEEQANNSHWLVWVLGAAVIILGFIVAFLLGKKTSK